MTAFAAAATLHLFGARHASQFQSLRDVLIHGFLDGMKILLGFDETGGDGIGDESVTFFFVIGDFFGREADALLLLVLEMFAFFGEVAVELFGVFVTEKRVDFAAQSQISRILQNRFAKFARFKLDQTLLCNS